MGKAQPASKKVETEVAIARASATLAVGAEHEMTLGQLLDSIGDDDGRHALNTVLGLRCRDIQDLVQSQRPVDIQIGAPKRRRKKAASSTKGKNGVSQELTTPQFDALVVDTIQSLQQKGDVKTGQLLAELGCSRGKLRLSLGRLKDEGRVRQTGERNGAHYSVVQTTRAEAPAQE